MAVTKAGLVNQQFYHAKLLLQMQQQLKTGPELTAQNLALENAISHSLLLALQGFLQEFAESCQLQALPTNLDELAQEMAKNEKQHPVLQELLVLRQQNSWLQQLLETGSELLTRTQAQAQSLQKNQLLAVEVLEDDKLSLQALLEQMQKFVQNQREYLQEY